MKTRLQNFYNYLLRNEWANPNAGISAVLSREAKEKQIQTRINNAKSLFDIEKLSDTDRTMFRLALRALKATHIETILFGNITDDLNTDYALPTDFKIREKFKVLESKYQYFPDAKNQELAFKKFKDLFIISKIVADLIEHNNNEPEDVVAYLHAYKILVIFADQDDPAKLFQSIDNYLQLHNYLKLEHPLHDALVGSIPECKPTNQISLLPEWRKLIQNSGSKAFKLFNRALNIEAKLIEDFPQKSAQKHILANYKSALNYAKKITYKRAMEYEELAELFLNFGFSEQLFDKALDIDKNRKKFNSLPSTMVDGSEIGLPGYYLFMLPLNVDNPTDKYRAIAYVLGHITNCCQSLGGASENCVIDGIRLPSNGFLLLLKDESITSKKQVEEKKSAALDVEELIDKCRIMGQGYIWLSKWKNLVIDSWENLNEQDDDITVSLLERYAQKVFADRNFDILRISIGDGGKTPKEKFASYVSPEYMLEGRQYGDSLQQKLVALNEDLQNKLYDELQKDLKETIQSKINPLLELKDYLHSKQIISKEHAVAIKGVFNDAEYQELLRNLYQDPLQYDERYPFYLARMWSTLALLYQAKICPSEHFIKNYMGRKYDFDVFSAMNVHSEYNSITRLFERENFIYLLRNKIKLDKEVLDVLIFQTPWASQYRDQPILMAVSH